MYQMTKFTEFLSGYEENTVLLAPVKQANLLFFDAEKGDLKDQVNKI